MTNQQERILNEFVDYLKIQGKSFKNHKSGIKIYFNYLEKRDADYLRTKISDAQEFQQYLTTLANEDGSSYYNASSILALIGRLTSFYNYLKMKKYIYINPFLEIEKIRRSKGLPKNILKEEDMNRLLSHLKDFMKGKNLIERRQLYKAHVISELMYSSAARINEVANLKVSDIDFIRGIVKLREKKTVKRGRGY